MRVVLTFGLGQHRTQHQRHDFGQRFWLEKYQHGVNDVIIKIIY